MVDDALYNRNEVRPGDNTELKFGYKSTADLKYFLPQSFYCPINPQAVGLREVVVAFNFTCKQTTNFIAEVRRSI